MKFSFPVAIPAEGKLQEFLRSMVTEIRRFSDRNIDVRQNLKATSLTVTTAVADTEVTVNHNLGVTPFIYLYTIDKNGVVYDSRKSDWTSSQIFIKCSVADATITLFVFS